MSARLPRVAPIPAPDRHQLEQLNRLYVLEGPRTRAGWRGRVGDYLRGILARILFRQQEFNAALVDHINRNALVALQTHQATTETFAWMQEALDDLQARTLALADRHQRLEEAFTEAEREFRMSIGVLQHGVQALRRDAAARPAGGDPPPRTPSSEPAGGADAAGGFRYVGFEDCFRGAPEEIRRRVADYVPIFAGARDVLDLGCGRGEFLAELRDRGIPARGIDINDAMVDVCRQQGLDATRADALAYLRGQPDESLGGLFSAHVVEHLEPAYLHALLDTAFDKLRPGAPIVIETINVASWLAFFESYIRDITHERPLHPETLRFLLIANGFQQVEIRYRSPCPDEERLHPIAAGQAPQALVDALNTNIDRLNRRLFAWLDYAVVGRRA